MVGEQVIRDAWRRALRTAAAVDGGRTWVIRMAAFSRCTGGNVSNGADYPRASDPWVSFGPDGTVYQSSLVFRR